MSANSKIEWTGSTWNPIRFRLREDVIVGNRVVKAGQWGYHCEPISPGCKNCYAGRMNGRAFPAWGTGLDYNVPNREKVSVFLDEEELLRPLHWKRSRKIFPCSMTDMFADFVPDAFLEKIWAVMAICHWHEFQMLTKRAQRLDWLPKQLSMAASLLEDHIETFVGEYAALAKWPLPNVQVGFSAEDQKNFDERWRSVRPLALQGWRTWCSLEPLLGPVDLNDAVYDMQCQIGWAVVGGESGIGARPMHPDWAHSIKDQCQASGVPFFFKQWGEWQPRIGLIDSDKQQMIRLTDAGENGQVLGAAGSNDVWMQKVGKVKAGRLLDGREWNEFPEIAA